MTKKEIRTENRHKWEFKQYLKRQLKTGGL